MIKLLLHGLQKAVGLLIRLFEHHLLDLPKTAFNLILGLINACTKSFLLIGIGVFCAGAKAVTA
jgi:hypothetical protein